MTDPNAEYLCPGCFTDKGNVHPCPHCGYDEQAPRGPLPLPHWHALNGQFLIGRVLGKPGGFGLTYLGWDQQLHTRVAIKEYLPRDLATRITDGASVAAHTHDDNDLFRYGLTQFIGEARTLAQLDHPNIVRVRQFFEANGTAYLVMDYYDGLSLAEYLEQQGGKLPEQAATQLMLPILDGLRAVHAKGFLHRDVKPQNIYLAKTDTGGTRPILLDFGAARQAMGERSRSLSVIVSAGYAPFEQHQRKGQLGPWTDVYAAAAVFYRSVTGQEPPEAMERMPDDNLQPPTDFGVSLSLSNVLSAALGIYPKDRPQTVAEFQHQLRDAPTLAASTPAPETTPINTDPPEPKPEKPKANKQPSWLFFATLLALPLGAFLAGDPIRTLLQQYLIPDDKSALVQHQDTHQPNITNPERQSVPRTPYSDTLESHALESFSEPTNDGIQAPESARAVDPELLMTCREYMAERQYTHPNNNNALLCFRRVLRQDPDNREAKDAFAFMTSFYIDSAEDALRAGNRERVKDRIARLRRVDALSEDASRLKRLLQAFTDTAGLQCEAASTRAERAICESEPLQTLTEQMTAAYKQVESHSTQEEASMLQRAQARWISERDRNCERSPDSEFDSCLEQKIEQRISVLIADNDSESAGNRLMPFFLSQDGDPFHYQLDGQFLRFIDPKNPGEKAFNRIAKSIFADAPRNTETNTGTQVWDWTGAMSISLLTPEFLSAKNSVWGYTGGAHGYSHEKNFTIDMQTGKFLQLRNLFSQAALRRINNQCYHQIISQKGEKLTTYNPHNDDQLTHESVAKVVNNLENWSFTERGASVYFGEYSVGSYGEGIYRCQFSIADLKDNLLATAPMPKRWKDARQADRTMISGERDGMIYVSDAGIQYRSSANNHGLVLRASDSVLYLGKECDAYSPEFGTGTWGWSNSGFSVRFDTAQTSFPNPGNPMGNQRCQL